MTQLAGHYGREAGALGQLEGLWAGEGRGEGPGDIPEAIHLEQPEGWG